MTATDRFIVTFLLLCLAAAVLIVVVELVDRAIERQRRRVIPRPRIPADERRLLGVDWVATAKQRRTR